MLSTNSWPIKVFIPICKRNTVLPSLETFALFSIFNFHFGPHSPDICPYYPYISHPTYRAHKLSPDVGHPWSFSLALGLFYYHTPSFTCSFHFVSVGFTFLCLLFTFLSSLLDSQALFRPFSVSFSFILLSRLISHCWICSSVLSLLAQFSSVLVWFSDSLEVYKSLPVLIE